MTLETPVGYKAQTIESLPKYLKEHLPTKLHLGGEPETWGINEIGDGNLNLVFIVSGSEKSIIVKQALPYVRAAGESWPLSLTRAFFEFNILVEERKYAGGELVPEAYFYDEEMALFVMEFLTPHIILRKELIAGKKFENLSNDVGVFLARTLFHTSDIGMDAAKKKKLVSRFAVNHELCRITEDLIFSEPYFDAERNNWTTPELDTDVAAVWQDKEMIQVAMKYKYKFMTEAQALIHGDLHSGSIMVTETDTKVIDPEFGFYAPMAFDIGNYIGNLFMSYFSQDGHQSIKATCDNYKEWLTEQIEKTWTVFESEFRTLWRDKKIGDAYPNSIYQDNQTLLNAAQDDFFRSLFIDTLVNAGLEMNRRIIGFAGVADFKQIENTELRAQCERRALKLARQLIVNAESFTNIEQVGKFASQC
ncbi:S-methyl-5-thioribose kinase [Pseudomonadota bacterium]